MSNKAVRTGISVIFLAVTFSASRFVVASGAPDTEAATAARGEAYYEMIVARLAARQGKPVEVREHLRKASALQPDSVELHAEAANLLVLLGDREEAATMARRALALDPEEPKALRVIADLAAAKAVETEGDVASRDEAIRLYERLARDPDVADEVLGLLANLKMHAGDNDGAVDAARRFAERRPGDEDATSLLSRSLAYDGQPVEALDTLLDHLISYPDSEDLVLQVSDLARKTEDWDRIEEFCGRLVEVRPAQSLPRGLRGQALLRLGRVESAAEELERSLVLAPAAPAPAQRSFYLVTRSHLLTAYDELGRLADAAEVARSLASDFPGNPAVRSILGEVLAEQEDVQGAIENYGAALQIFAARDEAAASQRDELRRRIAALEVAAGRPQAAARRMAEIESPGDDKNLDARARIALLTGRIAEARELSRTLRESGRLGLAVMLEGEILLERGKVRAAGKRFEQVLQASGHDARPRIAELYHNHGHETRGEQILRDWVVSAPGSADAHLALGSYVARAGRVASAEPFLREAIRLRPSDARALNTLGYVLLDRDDRLGEALELIRRAVDLDRWNGAFMDSLGWAYYKLGRYDEAKHALERAVREFPFDPTVLDHLGDLYQRLGNRDGAIDAWSRALMTRPANAMLLRSKISKQREERALQSRALEPSGSNRREGRPANP